MQRPFLKWAGGKFNLLPHILPQLPTGRRFFEPFLGAATVFLNTDYDEYHLGDTNADLINLYKTVKLLGEDYIKHAFKYFKPRYNESRKYYQLREKFNQSCDPIERSCLFLYLNRHGYNGLCRYNRSGRFNVPFGSYKKILFPDEAIYAFHKKSQNAKFYCDDFSKIMKKANKLGDIIYADPPYYPLSKSANFTSYGQIKFSHDDQQSLADLSEKLATKNVHIVISNQLTPETQVLYQKAKLYQFPVRRSISCRGNRRYDVEELLAVYCPKDTVNSL